MIIAIYCTLILLGLYLILDGCVNWCEEMCHGPAIRAIGGVLVMLVGFTVAIWGESPQEVRIPKKATALRTELVNTETGVDTVYVYEVTPLTWTTK